MLPSHGEMLEQEKRHAAGPKLGIFMIKIEVAT